MLPGLPWTSVVIAPQARRGEVGREEEEEGGQTAPHRPGPPDQQGAAAIWRFAGVEKEGIGLGLRIER